MPRACLPCWDVGSCSERPTVGGARSVSGLRPGPEDSHCSGDGPLVAAGPRLLHTWMFVGCVSAAPLHPRGLAGSQDGCRDVTPPDRVPALHVSPSPACG